jgi:hypothetical protein
MTTPKILVENKNAFGSPVEQVALDSNRVDVNRESISRFANVVALNSRGLWVDTTQWVIYTAGLFSAAEIAYLAGMPIWGVSLLFGLPVLVLCALIGSVMDRRKSLVGQGAVRYILLFIGGLLAVL